MAPGDDQQHVMLLVAGDVCGIQLVAGVQEQEVHDCNQDVALSRPAQALCDADAVGVEGVPERTTDGAHDETEVEKSELATLGDNVGKGQHFDLGVGSNTLQNFAHNNHDQSS